MYVFYVTRGLLAFICAGCETYFYIGVSKEIGKVLMKLYIHSVNCGLEIAKKSDEDLNVSFMPTC